MVQDAFDGDLNCSFIFSTYESLLKSIKCRFAMQFILPRQSQNFAFVHKTINTQMSSLDKKKFILILDFDTTIRTTGVRL